MAIGHIYFPVPKRVIPKAFLRPFRCGCWSFGSGWWLCGEVVCCKSCCGGKVSGIFGVQFFGGRFLSWRGETFFHKNLAWRWILQQKCSTNTFQVIHLFHCFFFWVGVQIWKLLANWDAPKAICQDVHKVRKRCAENPKVTKLSGDFFLRFQAFSGGGRCLETSRATL